MPRGATRFSSLTLSLAGLGLLGAIGCGSTPVASGGGAGDLGTITVPLDATSASGVQYHLANATFLITGAATAALSGDADSVQRDLAPGSYQIQLLDGFQLFQVDPDGTEHQVSATLDSPNPQSFVIRSHHTTTVTFSFRVGQIVVATGDGTVSVAIAVHDTLIDDFEDGDDHVALIAGRNGSWFTFSDGTGTETPAPGADTLPDLDAAGNFLMRVTGTGFAVVGTGSAFGAAVGANLVDDPNAALPLPYDASAYTGIAFTTSLATSGFAQVRLDVATVATTPVELGGSCTSGCSDDFGVTFSPPPFFPFPETFSFSFSQLTQQGFGAPTTFDPKTILNIKWLVQPLTTPTDFTFTLDNVSFTQ